MKTDVFVAIAAVCGDGRTEVSTEWHCDSQHGAVPWCRCSVCGRDDVPQGSSMYGCQACDWDACADCYEAGADGRQVSQATRVYSQRRPKDCRVE